MGMLVFSGSTCTISLHSVPFNVLEVGLKENVLAVETVSNPPQLEEDFAPPAGNHYFLYLFYYSYCYIFFIFYWLFKNGCAFYNCRKL